MAKQTLTDLDGLPERLDKAAQHVEDARAKLDNAIRARDALIVAAVDDAGMTQRKAAQHARLSVPSVVRVLIAAAVD